MQDKRFGVFVVRYWRLPDGEQRLDIEHVQSGERLRCASLLEAEAWLAARVLPQAPGDPAAQGRGDGVAEHGDARG